MAKAPVELENTQKVQAWDYVKKKRRWSCFWGVFVASLVMCLIFSASQIDPAYPPSQEQIARVNIEGVIYDDEYRLEMLREIQKRDDVKALIVNINSPGGTVFASEEIYGHIRKIADNVPVVSLMRDSAASGGYIAALAGDHMIAGHTTVTGSIGVISEVPNVTELMDNIGVSTTITRSSEAKGGVSPTHEPTPEELADKQQLIDGMYDWFRGLVGERRALSGNALLSVTQGTVYTGDQALDLGLIDEIGGHDEAMAYFETQDASLKDLEIVDWEPDYSELSPEAYVKSLAEATAHQLKNSLTHMSVPSFMAIMD